MSALCNQQRSASGTKHSSKSRTTSSPRNLSLIENRVLLMLHEEQKTLMAKTGTDTRQRLAAMGKKGTDAEEACSEAQVHRPFLRYRLDQDHQELSLPLP